MRALDIMTTSVIKASPDMAISAAAKLLAEHRISGMPVVDTNGKVVGIVSDGDLLRRAEIGAGQRSWLSELFSPPRNPAAGDAKDHARVVGDVMTQHVISVSENMPLKEIADILERRRIKRVPVMKNGQMVGIVSRSNLIRALASLGQPDEPFSVDDARLRDAIVSVMSGARWGLPAESVLVKDGVVHLWGVVGSEEEDRAIRVAAERVPGVKRVESHLEYPRFVAPK